MSQEGDKWGGGCEHVHGERFEVVAGTALWQMARGWQAASKQTQSDWSLLMTMARKFLDGNQRGYDNLTLASSWPLGQLLVVGLRIIVFAWLIAGLAECDKRQPLQGPPQRSAYLSTL